MSSSSQTIIETLRRNISIPSEERLIALNERHLEYLLDIGLQTAPRAVLEIGLGWGYSGAAIELIGSVEQHVVIEIERGSERSLQGEKNIRSFSSSSLSILWGDSGLVLPSLCQSGRQFDLVLIDGGHRFDDVFVDFHFVRKLVRSQGIVFLDDLWMPSIKKLLSFVDANLSDQWVRISGEDRHTEVALQWNGAPDNRPWDHFVEFL